MFKIIEIAEKAQVQLKVYSAFKRDLINIATKCIEFLAKKINFK